MVQRSRRICGCKLTTKEIGRIGGDQVTEYQGNYYNDSRYYGSSSLTHIFYKKFSKKKTNQGKKLKRKKNIYWRSIKGTIFVLMVFIFPGKVVKTKLFCNRCHWSKRR